MSAVIIGLPRNTMIYFYRVMIHVFVLEIIPFHPTSYFDLLFEIPLLSYIHPVVSSVSEISVILCVFVDVFEYLSMHLEFRSRK